MIVRIAGEGQYDVDDAALDGLNQLDSEIEQALEARDEAGLPQQPRPSSSRRSARPARQSAEDDIVPSDLLLPHAEATLDEVRELLGEEGLIPG